MSLWGRVLRISMVKILPRVCVYSILLSDQDIASTMCACTLLCSPHDNELSETVCEPPQLNVFLISVAVVMVSLHPN